MPPLTPAGFRAAPVLSWDTAGLATAAVMTVQRQRVEAAKLSFLSPKRFSSSDLRPPLWLSPHSLQFINPPVSTWFLSFCVGLSDPCFALTSDSGRASSLHRLPSYQELQVPSSQKFSRPFSLQFQR